MKKISIQNRSYPYENELHIRYCEGFLPRFLGLMFQPPLDHKDGILLVQNRESRIDAGIHMFFMRSDLTIVWINSHKKVVDKKLAKRWHPYYFPEIPALYVLECSPTRFTDFNLGDELAFKELDE